MQVTAVVPMYNARATILRALDSIRMQTKAVTQILVVDDGSTDGSRDVVESAQIPNLVLIRTPANGGPGAARNLGAKSAVTDWVAMLDADDIWMPTFLERVCEAISRFDAQFGSSGGVRSKTYQGKSSRQTRLIDGPHEALDLSPRLWRVAFRFIPIHCSALVVSRRLFEHVGGFPEDVRTGEDVSLWATLWLNGRFAFVNEPLFESVATDNGLSAGRLSYTDVRRGSARMLHALVESLGSGRKGRGWFAAWLIVRIARRHLSWMVRKLRLRATWNRLSSVRA